MSDIAYIAAGAFLIVFGMVLPVAEDAWNGLKDKP